MADTVPIIVTFQDIIAFATDHECRNFAELAVKLSKFNKSLMLDMLNTPELYRLVVDWFSAHQQQIICNELDMLANS